MAISKKLKSFRLLLTTCVLIMGCTFLSSAQSADNEKNDTKDLLQGTFQIQRINSRDMISVPEGLLDSINERRDQTRVVYIDFHPRARIMILPFSEIRSTDFKPIPSQSIVKSFDHD